MEYFVSIENTSYYHWQIELMIESFKKNNCEENLLIALAKEDQILYKDFCKNLFAHERIYGHQNIGSIRGFKPFNELYSLLWSVQYSLIKQPFTLLSPDMVLRENIFFVDSGVPEIIFAPNPFFTLENAESEVGPFWEWCEKTKTEMEINWIPFGVFAVFNNIPTFIFERVVILAELFAMKQLVENKEIWAQTTKLAWACALHDFVGEIKMNGDYSLTDTMLGNSNSPIIYYEHGLPPVFNKLQFTYQPPGYVAFGDPIEILAQHAPTANAHYMADIAKENLSSRK